MWPQPSNVFPWLSAPICLSQEHRACCSSSQMPLCQPCCKGLLVGITQACFLLGGQ